MPNIHANQDSIYYHSMHALPLAALALLVALSGCSIPEIMFQQTYVNYTHLLCLQSRGALDDFFIQGELESTEEFKFFLTSVDFEQLEPLALQPHFNVTLQSLHFYFPPETSALVYANTLRDYYYKMLWFDVARTELEIGCEMIWTFVSKLRALTGKRVGIIGNRGDWVEKFGSDSACSQFSTFPLFFSGETFEPFAGWDTYEFSQGDLHTNVCGVNYYDVRVFRQDGPQLSAEEAAE